VGHSARLRAERLRRMTLSRAQIRANTASDMGCANMPNFKLRRRPCRQSHHGIVQDPPQGKLADVPVQREVRELSLGRVR
jgi:hypothetical protein